MTSLAAAVAGGVTLPAIDPAALMALRASMPGRVFTSGEEGYEAARTGYSLADLPTPDVVVKAASAADVAEAVRFAAAQGLPVGVRATGHNFGAAHVGGVMINTSLMQGYAIDPVARTARVEAGVIWRPVVAAAHRHGLAPLNGSSPTVGVVGYSLFGGFGWLLRRHGPAVDSVVAVEVVTADGQRLRASADEHPDLFWALRGGSGNFGVVTALEFRLYPISHVYGGALFWPMERAEEVFAAYSRWTASAPEELTSSIVLLRLPPLPGLPPFLAGKPVVTVRACVVGDEAAGAALLAPMRALGGVVADTLRLMPYTEVGSINADPEQPGAFERKSMMLKDLSPATVAAVLRADGPAAESPVMVLEIRHLGGAMTRVPAGTSAFDQRHAPFICQTIDVLMEPEQAEVAKRHARAVAEALRPHATGGVLPSWLGDGDHGVERTRAGFSAATYARLTALKRRYDPANTFRLNHNIPPAQAALAQAAD